MLGIEPWPSARAVSTLNHRSSLWKSSLFTFVGFLRQNRHSGVLAGCCVLRGWHLVWWERPSLTQPLQGHECPMPCITSGRQRWTQSSLLEALNSDHQKESHARKSPFAGYTCSCTHWITRSAAECRVCSHETLTSGTPWVKVSASDPRKPCFS